MDDFKLEATDDYQDPSQMDASPSVVVEHRPFAPSFRPNNNNNTPGFFSAPVGASSSCAYGVVKQDSVPSFNVTQQLDPFHASQQDPVMSRAPLLPRPGALLPTPLGPFTAHQLQERLVHAPLPQSAAARSPSHMQAGPGGAHPSPQPVVYGSPTPEPSQGAQRSSPEPKPEPASSAHPFSQALHRWRFGPSPTPAQSVVQPSQPALQSAPEQKPEPASSAHPFSQALQRWRFGPSMCPTPTPAPRSTAVALVPKYKRPAKCVKTDLAFAHPTDTPLVCQLRNALREKQTEAHYVVSRMETYRAAAEHARQHVKKSESELAKCKTRCQLRCDDPLPAAVRSTEMLGRATADYVDMLRQKEEEARRRKLAEKEVASLKEELRALKQKQQKDEEEQSPDSGVKDEDKAGGSGQ